MFKPVLFAEITLSVSIAFLGCARSERALSQNRTVHICVRSDGETSKTAILPDGKFVWTEGDAIKLLQTAGGEFSVYDSADGVSTDGGKTMTFALEIPEVSASQYDYAAFYPKSALSGTPESASSVGITLPASQAPQQASFDHSADVLLAEPRTCDSQPAELGMRFRRPCALGRIALGSFPSSDPVKSISISATKGGVPVMLAGTSVFDLSVPFGNPKNYGSDQILTLDCTGIDFSAQTGAVPDYSVDYFDWTMESTVSSGSTPRELTKSSGAYFTCWPFALSEGDSFTVKALAGVYEYTRTVTLPSGRSLEFTPGDLSSFTVNMSSAVATLAPVGRYASFLAGEDISTGSITLNSASGYEAVYVNEALILNDSSCQNKIFFVQDGSITIGSGAQLYNTFFIGNTPGEKPSVSLAGDNFINLKGSSPSSGQVAFCDVTLDGSARSSGSNEVLFKVNTGAGTGLGTLAIDNCSINYSGKGLLWASGTGETVHVSNLELTACNWGFAEPAAGESSSSWILLTSAASSAFENIVIKDNVFHSNVSGVSRSVRGISGAKLSVSNLDISGNVFLNVKAESFAAIGTAVNYTAIGNLVYNDVPGEELYSFTGARSMYNYRGTYYYLLRLAQFSSMPSGKLNCVGNMVYSSDGGNNLIDYYWPGSESPVVSVPSHHTPDPFSAVDVAAGTFTYNRILGECTAAMDGRKVWNVLDVANRTVYIRHDPTGDTVSDIGFNCFAGGEVTGGLSGSWPAKSVTLSRGSQTENWTVRLLDVPQSSDIQLIDGYAADFWKLEWADEFLLDDYDRETWARRERISDTPNSWTCYYETPARYPGFDDLVSVQDGELVLRARYTGDSNLGANGYVSSGVNTLSMFDRSTARKSFKLCDSTSTGFWGRIDVRVSYKLGDSDQGIRAAVWMLPDAYPEPKNPTGGELDILEHPSHIKKQGNWVRNYRTLHTVHNQYTYNDIGKTGGIQWGMDNPDETQYHVYSVVIAYNDYVRYYVDGVQVGQYDRRDYVDTGFPKWHWWPFDRYNYYLLFTHQLIDDQTTASEKGWDGPASGPFTDTRMNIDYVRYFIKK